jgi:hypothetical protein
MALRVQVNSIIYSHRFHVRMYGKVGARLTVAILGFSITPAHMLHQ